VDAKQAGLLALAAFAAALAGSGEARADDESDDREPDPRPKGSAPGALLAGAPTSPEVAPMLAQLDALLASAGHTWTSARELLTMRKAPRIGGELPVAIPPPELWPNILPVLELVRGLDPRPPIVSAYRAPDYNAAVGGAPNSAHTWFRALDLGLEPPLRSSTLDVLLAAYRAGEPLGLGVYGYPKARRVHVDLGHGRRTWKDTAKHLEGSS
jgi:hypothetical protein